MIVGIAIAVVGCVVTSIMRADWIALVFGVLLPIDYVQGVDPGYLDLLRYVLAVALIIKSWRRYRVRIRTGGVPLIVVLILGFLGIYIVVAGLLGASSAMVGTGLTALAASSIAYFVGCNIVLHKRIALGFWVAMCLCSIDIISQAAGGPYLGMTSVYGMRYSGFSFTSTAAAPFLAISIVLAVTTWMWPRGFGATGVFRTIVRLSSIVPLALGLYLSGGRGGIVGLMVALLVGLAVHLKNRPKTSILLFFLVAVVAFVLRNRLLVAIFRPDEVDFSSGRDNLNLQAWEAFVGQPLFGVSPGTAVLLRPHTPVLTFAVEAGIVGLVIGVFLIAVTARIALLPSREEFPVSLRMMASVMFVTSLLEPDGFFIGLSKVMLFMIVVVGFYAARSIEVEASTGLAPAAIPRLPGGRYSPSEGAASEAMSDGNRMLRN